MFKAPEPPKNIVQKLSEHRQGEAETFTVGEATFLDHDVFSRLEQLHRMSVERIVFDESDRAFDLATDWTIDFRGNSISLKLHPDGSFSQVQSGWRG